MSTNYNTTPAGPQLDRIIAEKVMGWQWENGQAKRSKPKDAGGWEVTEWFEFKPSASIAHAWLVVAAVRVDDKFLTVVDAAKGEAYALVHHYRDWPRSLDDMVRAETVALAICRAALRALD